MRRRQFITLLGGASAAWPLAARAQQPERMRRIGLLLPAAADDAEFQARVGAFLQALALLGWSIGRNVRIDTRWAGSNAADIRRHAGELAALAPDVILAHGGLTVGPLLQATRTEPIVFPVVADPVVAGIVDSLARPGGNVTGFMTYESQLLQRQGVTHKRTRPYRPQTNGKVERFNRTLLAEWAYARPYRSERARRAALPAWLHRYNHHRPHTALGGLPPANRVPNLSGQNS